MDLPQAKRDKAQKKKKRNNAAKGEDGSATTRRREGSYIVTSSDAVWQDAAASISEATWNAKDNCIAYAYFLGQVDLVQAGSHRVHTVRLESKQPIGFIFVRVDCRRKSITQRVTLIWVHPNERRKGVGKLLMAQLALDLAADADATLHLRGLSADSRALYTSLGIGGSYQQWKLGDVLSTTDSDWVQQAIKSEGVFAPAKKKQKKNQQTQEKQPKKKKKTKKKAGRTTPKGAPTTTNRTTAVKEAVVKQQAGLKVCSMNWFVVSVH